MYENKKEISRTFMGRLSCSFSIWYISKIWLFLFHKGNPLWPYLNKLSICKLNEKVFFSIRYMSLIVSTHSLIVGGLGYSQCLVMVFLAAVIIIRYRFLWAFPLRKSASPRKNILKWLGILISNISSVVLCTSDQKCFNPGHSQNIGYANGLHPDPHSLANIWSLLLYSKILILV